MIEVSNQITRHINPLKSINEKLLGQKARAVMCTFPKPSQTQWLNYYTALSRHSRGIPNLVTGELAPLKLKK